MKNRTWPKSSPPAEDRVYSYPTEQVWMGQVGIVWSSCESVCDFMGSKLARAGGLSVSESDYRPHDCRFNSPVPPPC